MSRIGRSVIERACRVGVLAATVTLLGCSFTRLNEDLKRADKEPDISGTIFDGDWTGKVVKVYLFERAHGEQWFPLIFRQIVVQRSPGNYEFVAPHEGDYLIMAFEDINDDGRLDPGEPVGAVNDFEPMFLREGGILVDQDMMLSKNAPPRLAHFSAQPIELDARVSHGRVRDLESETFGVKTGPLGMWQPLTFVDRYGWGLYMLQPFEPDKFPVVFIHGMAGYPAQFKNLIESLDRKEFQPWVMQYPSGARLEEVVQGLLMALELVEHELRAKADLRELLVVAHSMGGLVAHRMVREHFALPRKPWIACLATFSSPLGGMPSADAGVKHAPSVVPSWRDVGPASDFVSKLFEHPFPDGLPYHLYFGYGGTGAFSSHASDGTVRLASQLMPEAQALATTMAGYEATHEGILALPESSARLNRDLASCVRKLRREDTQTRPPSHVSEGKDAGAKPAAQYERPLGRFQPQ